MRTMLFGATLLMSACATTARPDTPAVLVEPDAATHAEIVKVVSGALHVESVTIADDALTHESLLVIERHPARDATGQRLSGRDFELPEQFRLVINGTQCVLVHERTGERYTLTSARCQPH